MISTEYYDLLFNGLDDGLRVREIVHGVSWTAAVLSDGRTGVAMHTAGETAPRLFPSLEGLPLKLAAQAVMSWNMEEASEGLAAVNAFYNTGAHIDALGLPGRSSALEGVDVTGRTVGFIGHLVSHSGITEELLAPAKAYYIMEREPREGDYPDSACEYLLPDCDLVVITGSAAINKTLPRLLQLAAHAEVVMTGPSVTLCPELMGLGIRRMHGSAIVESEAMLRGIVEKRCSVNPWSRHFTLDA